MRQSSREESHSRISKIAERLEEFENKRQTEFDHVSENYAQALSSQASVIENYAQAIENYAQGTSRHTTEAKIAQERVISAKRAGMIGGAAGAAVALAWSTAHVFFSSSPAWLVRIMHILFLGSFAFPAL